MAGRVHVQGASKIRAKNANKKSTVIARRLIFFEFFKTSIADLITLLFSSLQNSEGGGDGNSGDSCADPPQFLPQNLTSSLSPPLLRTLEKKLQKQKSLLGSM